MTTKEEYEKAIENIREAFYATTCPEWALEKFATNLDFISISIKEHFEEKDEQFEEEAETNLERYYDDLIKEDCSDFGVVNGKIESCTFIPCEKCEFKSGNCHKNRITWLTSKCEKKKHKFTQFEYDLINTYRHVDDRCKFNGCYQLKSLKEKGYFKYVDKNELIKDILANCEVV